MVSVVGTSIPVGDRQVHPTVTISADSTIFNCEYDFPRSDGEGEGSVVFSEPCKLTLERLGAAVLFARNTVTLFIADEQKRRNDGYRLLDLLVDFIIYRSRVNYHIYQSHWADEVNHFDTYTETGPSLAFNLERLNGQQGIKKVGDRWVALGSDPYPLQIARSDFDDFHKLLDRSLAYAISYFLVASETPQYFLVEYYKCLEMIKQKFSDERTMISALEPHGLTKKMYKSLTGSANNFFKPIAFGRHAPKKGVAAIGIDRRSLHTPSMQRDLFAESTKICRAAIDSYITHLLTSPDVLSEPTQ